VLARWLDSAVRLPRTHWRVGLDPLLGLIPVIGDLAGLALSLLIVAASWRLGASAGTLARMVLNITLDAVIGSVPVVGDVYDVFARTNERNVRALERALGQAGDEPVASAQGDRRDPKAR
jgi:hypothetical protein